MEFPGICIGQISSFMTLHGYPVAGYGSLLGAAESAPEPFESNKISIFYLTRKGSGQASDSNSIPHALSESSGIQTFPYPAIGYPCNPIKPEIGKIQIPGISIHRPNGPMSCWGLFKSRSVWVSQRHCTKRHLLSTCTWLFTRPGFNPTNG